MSVNVYIENQPPLTSIMLNMLRTLILDTTISIDERFSFNVPFYYYNGMLCYLSTDKQGVYLGFCYGIYLSNEHGLMQLKKGSKLPVCIFQIRKKLRIKQIK